MKILFHQHFEKQYKKLRESEKERFKKRIEIFIKDQLDPILGNHSLRGKYQGYRSINITGDLRAIYKEIKTNTFLFAAIDTHNKLYGK